MLIGNIRQNQKNPMKWIGGIGSPQVRSNFNYPGAQRNYLGTMPYASIANGYRPPYTWQMSRYSGGLSSSFGIVSSSLTTGSLSAGMNIDADLYGYGAATSIAQLVIDMLAPLSSSASVAAAMTGVSIAVAYCSATGTCSAALAAMAYAISTVSVASSTVGHASALAHVAADIQPFTALSPESLSAAVWNSQAKDFSLTGSMGKKLADAGGSSSPDDIAAAVWEHATTGEQGSKAADLAAIKNNTAIIPGLL